MVEAARWLPRLLLIRTDFMRMLTSSRRSPVARASSRALSASLLIFVAAALTGCGDETGEAAPAPGDQAAAAQDTASAPQAPGADGEELVDISAIGFDEGNVETAVVQVVEFSDFGCVHCANFHQNSYPVLYEEFVAGGDVVWKYIPVSIAGFPNAMEAAMSAECAAEQGAFQPMRSWLYENREGWMASDDPHAMFRDAAGTLLADAGAFETCMNEGGQALERIQQGTQIALDIGVRGTPTFVVQGFPVQGAPPLDQFQEALRSLVAEVQAQPGN
ncbi:MAG: hypothetical protein EA422_02915 [Gemmatimonadales bacterium]|nr:MAG: hypothetical protein EA422_02915 [Gemmatimonadales bacterium]